MKCGGSTSSRQGGGTVKARVKPDLRNFQKSPAYSSFSEIVVKNDPRQTQSYQWFAGTMMGAISEG